MSSAPRDAFEAAQGLADALEAAGIPHAIGGAIALGVHGVPRGTLDVDINVFIELDELARVLDVLQGMSVEVDRPSARTRAEHDGLFVGRWVGMRICVFVPSIPFSWEAARTRKRIASTTGDTAWFLAVEAIAVFKMLFFRGKDLVDLERLLAVRGGDIDHAYVRRWLVDMMGEDDPRVKRWDEIVERYA